MSTDVRAAVLAAIADVAPEADAAAADGTAPLQQQLELDSMDFLDVLTAVAERTGVDVRERDYDRVATLDGLIAYVEAGLRAAARG